MDNTKDITKYLLRRLSNVILLFAILSEGNDKAYTVNLLDLGRGDSNNLAYNCPPEEKYDGLSVHWPVLPIIEWSEPEIHTRFFQPRSHRKNINSSGK